MEVTSAIERFHTYQNELDEKYNKWERIVKLSRDVTIESKRLIFHLHRIDLGDEVTRGKLVQEAEEKATTISAKWKQIATELRNEDHLAFLRAYSPGLQEYIEALSFLYYFKSDRQNTDPPLLPLHNLRDQLKFEDCGGGAQPDKMTVTVPATEYLLGVADTTGELMRLCISSAAKVTSQESKTRVYRLCSFVRALYEMFVSLSSLTGSSLGKRNVLANKMVVMRSSLQKVEDACYMLEVQGQEFPEQFAA